MYLAKVLVTACAFFSLASAEVRSVTVGSGFTFSPENYSSVVPGDIIQFTFTSSTPHSVTQSTRGTPCRPSPQGLDSGVLRTPNSVYNVTINATTPLYFYCKVSSHCERGMVFAVNVNSTTFDTFKATAMGGSVSSGSPASASSPVISSTPSATPGGYGTNTGSGAKTSVQKLTAGLAGVAFLVELFL